MKKPSKAAIAAGIAHAKKAQTDVVVGWNLFMSLRGPAEVFWPKRGKRFTKAAQQEFRCGVIITPDGSTFDLL